MKRKDLARLSRFQLRAALVMFVLFLGGVALSLKGTLQKIIPGWSPDLSVPLLAGLMIVFFVVVVMRGYVGLPKCPYCRARLTGWFLHIAIATGNCGMCGESIETEEN